MSEILRQLYDEQGRPIAGKGATKAEAFTGLLHGASHVWIWRQAASGIEVMLQRRSLAKASWPGKYDVSTAGHIDLGETPLAAAIRELSEEICLKVKEADLELVGVHRARLVTDSGLIENEFQFIYLHHLVKDAPLVLQEEEVAEIVWQPLATFAQAALDGDDSYVPYQKRYYELVTSSIERASSQA